MKEIFVLPEARLIGFGNDVITVSAGACWEDKIKTDSQGNETTSVCDLSGWTEFA